MNRNTFYKEKQFQECQAANFWNICEWYSLTGDACGFPDHKSLKVITFQFEEFEKRELNN